MAKHSKGKAKATINTFTLTRVAGVMSVRGEMIELPALVGLSLNIDGETYAICQNTGLNVSGGSKHSLPRLFSLADNNDLFTRLSNGRSMVGIDTQKLMLSIPAIKEFFRLNPNFGE